MQKIKNESDTRLFVRVGGMYCEHCIETVSLALGTLDGVKSVNIRQNIAEVVSSIPLNTDDIVEIIRKAGYETSADKISVRRRKVLPKIRLYEIMIVAAFIITAIIINKLFGYNIFNAIPTVDSGASYAMLFITGLFTSIHCIGMCGAIGIFASSETNSVRSLRRPLLYNAGRVVSYSLIGAVVGLAGSVFTISIYLRGVIIIIAGVFMLLMALSMLGIVRFRLPHFCKFRFSRGKYGAFAIGLLNGLMPCGPMQAMQLYALSTGSALSGAFAMFLFALGTVPLMLLSGILVNLSRGKAKIIIGKVSCILILLLSLSMLNRGLLGIGVDLTSLFPKSDSSYTAAVISDNIQTVELELDFDSYGDVIVQKGIPVKITIHAEEGKITGCNNEIVSVDFGFDVPIKPGENIIEFTPQKEGEYTFTCWMNMIKNRIKVIDDIDYFVKGN